jgi:corrinoid protein of di/trimethylamine methyltransferase
MPDFDAALDAMRAAVLDGDIDEARRLAALALAEGADPVELIERGFAEGLREVGELWEQGEYFLPELVQGAEAMRAAMDLLAPAIRARHGELASRGRVVIGTVRGDLHDIGKTLVATLLSAHGFEVHDLGCDVPVERFLEKAREVDAHVVAASALLTTTMPVQRELARAVREAGLGDRVRVLVGGSPTTPAWAGEIGASYAENAHQAVRVALTLVPA